MVSVTSTSKVIVVPSASDNFTCILIVFFSFLGGFSIGSLSLDGF
jgi:hypothetical protein